ncbi:MAG: sigma-70 family RNA polymerase sigma factor [Mariniblastus sp.]
MSRTSTSFTTSKPPSSNSPSASLKLLEQAKNGDANSLGLLLRRYFRYLNSLSHGHIDERIRMRVSPSDAVQETLLEAHRDFDHYAGTTLEEFTGWLRRIMFHNLASAIENHVLAAKRDVRKQQSLDEKINDASQSDSPIKRSLEADVSSPSSPAVRDESLKQLRVAISTLPETYRRVIEMRHFEGLSFNEIAVRLGRNSGATRMLWVRAVEKLKIEMPKNE